MSTNVAKGYRVSALKGNRLFDFRYYLGYLISTFATKPPIRFPSIKRDPPQFNWETHFRIVSLSSCEARIPQFAARYSFAIIICTKNCKRSSAFPAEKNYSDVNTTYIFVLSESYQNLYDRNTHTHTGQQKQDTLYTSVHYISPRNGRGARNSPAVRLLRAIKKRNALSGNNGGGGRRSTRLFPPRLFLIPHVLRIRARWSRRHYRRRSTDAAYIYDRKGKGNGRAGIAATIAKSTRLITASQRCARVCEHMQ